MATFDGFQIPPIVLVAASPIVTVFNGGEVRFAEVADETAPVAAVVTPAIGEAAADAELVVDVTDNAGLAYLTVFALTSDSNALAVVYRAAEFQPGFTIGSFVEAIAGGSRLHVRRDSGWPPGDVSLTYDLVDVAGNVGA